MPSALTTRRHPTQPLARIIASRRLPALVAGAVAAAAFVGGTGFGASSASIVVPAEVLGTLSITDPTGIDSSPAPTNSPTWTAGAPDVLNLGELAGTEVASASLTWLVSTTNPTGYQVMLSNASGAAPVLKSGANSIPDMGTAPAAPDTGRTSFGVSVGDKVGHAQAAAAFAGSPWGTTGASGTQGTLYRDVPVGGMQVAGRTAPQTNDPVTINFMAVSHITQLPQPGAYSGTIRISATA